MKRKQDVFVLAEELKAQGNVDENARATSNRGLKRIRKVGEEEETSGEVLLEVLDRRKQQEEEMWNELEEYISRGTQRRDEQVSSSATKVVNLETDFIEASSKT